MYTSAEPINALVSTAPTSQIEFLPSTETSRSPRFSCSALYADQEYSAF